MGSQFITKQLLRFACSSGAQGCALGLKKKKSTTQIETQPPCSPQPGKTPKTHSPPPEKATQGKPGWQSDEAVRCLGAGRICSALTCPILLGQPGAVLLQFLTESFVLAGHPADSPSSGTAGRWSGELMPLQTAVRNCRYIMGSAWILSFG